MGTLKPDFSVAARITRVFSVRPPQRYCQSSYSCLGHDQYSLDSRDNSDGGPRRAIDCGYDVCMYIRSARLTLAISDLADCLVEINCRVIAD